MLLPSAVAHVGAILEHAIEHRPSARAVVVADDASPLACLLAAAYREALPTAQHLRFDEAHPEPILAAFEPLQPGDLVVLIQSSSFRLGALRIRMELFRRGLKVIEHPHLGRMPEDEHETYVAALAYDRRYYREVGEALKGHIDRAQRAEVHSGGASLFFEGGLEPAKLNVGDYRGMTNVGGQFPIGEVFTEALDLEKVHGRVRIFVFGDRSFSVNVPERPITLVIEAGKVIDAIDSSPEFDRVLDQIRADEPVWVRELGFGMNRALRPDRRVSDIGTYERMCGIHLSLGAKHGVFDKPELKRKNTKHHVDVFAITESVELDGTRLFADGAWTV